MPPRGPKKTGDPKAPYGYRQDGKPRAKPGAKRASGRVRPKKVKGGSDKWKAKGGFKRDGTPMPATHNDKGVWTRDGAKAAVQKAKDTGMALGRPKGSFSMDKRIREAVSRRISKNGKTVGDALIEVLLEQASESSKSRLAIVRFVTERIDGKAIQPIRDLTPRNPLRDLSDEELRRLLTRASSDDIKPDPVADDGEPNEGTANGADDSADRDTSPANNAAKSGKGG